MRIAILLDGASAHATTPDQLILGTVDAIEQALAGHEIVRLAVFPGDGWISELRDAAVDMVFNMCEGIDGAAALEPAVIGVVTLLGLPCTGSGLQATALCLRKPVVNALLAAAALPVPPFAVVRRGDPVPAMTLPALCKPAAEDASIGIEQRSVVSTREELQARLSAMLEVWDEILVQQFIDGREVNVGILGDHVLPIAEIDFGAMPRGLWRIVTYRSKWESGSDEDLGAKPHCPAHLPPAVADHVRKVALAAWRLVGGQGYGRVDLRIDADGRPWILEVNTNPDIAPDAGLARMARVAGMDYPSLINAVCTLAQTDAAPPAPVDRWRHIESLSGMTTRVDT